jgi:hypothetical protein
MGNNVGGKLWDCKRVDHPACAYHVADVAGFAGCVGLALSTRGSRVRATRVGTEVCGPDMTWSHHRIIVADLLSYYVAITRLRYARIQSYVGYGLEPHGHSLTHMKV